MLYVYLQIAYFWEWAWLDSNEDLFLIREARRLAEGFQILQNSCKYVYSFMEAFPEFSEY
jgi:hypothetical protein